MILCTRPMPMVYSFTGCASHKWTIAIGNAGIGEPDVSAQNSFGPLVLQSLKFGMLVLAWADSSYLQRV